MKLNVNVVNEIDMEIYERSVEKGHGRVSSNGFKVYGKVDDNQFYGADFLG